MDDDRPVPWWRSWYRFWAWVLALALIILMLLGAVLDRIYFLAGYLLICTAGAAFGAAQVFAPRRFLEWRDDDTSTEAVREVGDAFDAALGVARGSDGQFDHKSIRRVRIIGVVVLLHAAGFAVGGTLAFRAGVLPPQ